jgi:ElaB/YqjD/DUF883 family membrane-anchored ribosome-binding protein
VGQEAGAIVSDPINDPGVTGPENESVPTERATDGVDRTADAAETQVRRTGRQVEQRIQDTSQRAQEQIRRTRQQATDVIRDTEAKVRHQAAEVQGAFGGEGKGMSEAAVAGSVGEAASQAVDLRRAIERDLDALQRRLPPGDEVAEKAKTAGGAVLGVVGAAAAATVAGKQRSKRKRLEREARVHAAAIARYLPGASAEPVTAARRGGGRGTLALLALVGAAVAAVIVSRRQGGDDHPTLDDGGPAR